jgi:hypothetical protein
LHFEGPRKNREIFGILNNHNMLPARQLQNTLKLVFTNKAEIGKASAVAAAAMARQVRRRGSHGGQGKQELDGGARFHRAVKSSQSRARHVSGLLAKTGPWLDVLFGT